MSDAVFAVIVVAPVGVVVYMILFGFNRMLRSRMQGRLQPGELITFQSTATRAGLTFPSALFSIREGYLIVTDLRLMSGSWAFPPFWQSIKETALRDVDDVETATVFGRTQVHITASGKKLALIPTVSRFWPFSRGLGTRLAESIRNARAAYR